MVIMSHFVSLHDLLTKLKDDSNCLNDIEIKTKNGKRKISQTIKSLRDRAIPYLYLHQ